MDDMLEFHSSNFAHLVPDRRKSEHILSLVSDVIPPKQIGAICSNLFIANRGGVKTIFLCLIVVYVIQGCENRDVRHNNGGLDSHMVHISAALTEHACHCYVRLNLGIL